MPSTSAAQHRAMEAAAHGRSTLGIPKKVGAEFVAADATKGNAAGVIFVAKDGDILLLRRSADEANYGGWWCLPGGKAEDGEDSLAAARRETKEETGFDCNDRLLKGFDSVVTPNKMAFHTFACGVDEKFAPVMKDGEHTGAAWFSIDGLPSKTHPAVVSSIKERLSLSDDMTPEDWAGLRDGFVKWTREEEREPEHATDKTVITKIDQAEVQYGRSTGENRCSGCANFLVVGPHCEIVKDPIGPDGWCNRFTRQQQVVKGSALDGRAFDARESLAFDRASSLRNYDADGRLHVAKTHISKANVCEYLGSEIPDFEKLGLDPAKLYKLWRHPDELKKAAASFNNLPLLSRHVPVDARDHRPELVIGSLGSEAEFNDPYLDNSMIVWAGEAIDDIENERKKELSSAYRYRADMTPGKTPDGEEYDGVMRDIGGNHTALVTEGRVGPDVLVADSKEILNMRGKPVKMTRTGAAVRSVIALHLMPRLAQDVRIDLRPILAKLTAKNYAASKPTIVAGITKATSGKLAKDASLEDVTGLIDALEKAPIADGDDEMDVEDLPEETMDGEGDIHSFLKGKLGEDDYAKACDMLKAGKAADTEETPEEKKKREQEEAKKLAGDVEAAVTEKTKDMVSKGAMDSAITAAVTTERKRQQDIADAREEVRPVVGALKGAFDSALGVYQAALGVLGVADADKINDLTACKAVMKAQRPQGAGPVPAPKIATDAKVADDLAKRFPHAAKIKVSAA